MQSGSTGKNVNSPRNSHRVPNSRRLSPPDRSQARSNIVRNHISPISSNFPTEGGKSILSPRDKSAAIATRGLISPTSPAHSVSQAPRMNGGSTSHTPVTRPRFDPMRTFRNSFLGKQTNNHGNSPDDDTPRSKGKGKEKARAAEDSLERARENKLSTKAKEIREWMKGKSGSEIHHSAIDAIKNLAMGNDETVASAKVRQMGGVRDLFKGRAARPGAPLRNRGPKPGQTYEIVDQRIIENNPERTVEISTWREQAATQAQTNKDERMSIYFLSADEYPQDGEYAANNTAAEVEWRVDGPDIPPEGMDYTQSGINRSLIADISHMGTPSQLQHSLSVNLEQPSPAPREETLSPIISEKDPSSSTKGNKENHIEVTIEHVDMATGSSTSVKRPHHHAPHQRRHYYRPTPIDKELPRSPQDHALSESTASTARSNSAIQFEAILQSCEPSLAHIAPVLRNLGIQKMEHLKAIAKLTPWIRDQEVKENALRQGVTVIEWAILLDKLNAL